MNTLKKMVSLGFTIVFFFATYVPAWADVCEDMRLRVTEFRNTVVREKAEAGRAERTTPEPWSDPALCAVASKVVDEAKYLDSHFYDGCFTNEQAGLLSDETSDATAIADLEIGSHDCGD